MKAVRLFNYLSLLIKTRGRNNYYFIVISTLSHLIKDSAIQAQELNIHGLILLSHRAYMKHLARSLQISVVTADDFTSTREVCFWQVVEVQVLKFLKKCLINRSVILRNK